MLKISSTESAKPRKSGFGVGNDSKARRNRNELDEDEVNDGEFENNEIGKKVQKTFKSKKLSKSKKAVELDFFTPRARLVFTKLKQAFLKALIFYHFNPERYIRIEIDIFGYAISGVLS